MPLLLNFVIKFRYCWQPNVEDYHLCIYSNSGRLEKHSVLKFICFKPLGHCNIFTFRKVLLICLFIYFFLYIFHDFLCVLVTWWIMFTFFSIWSLASAFWHTVSVLKSISYFVSISSVLFGISTALTLILARSCSDVRNPNPTQSKYPIACAPEYSRNLLSAQHFT